MSSMANRILLAMCLSIIIRTTSCWKDPNVPVLPTLTVLPQPPEVVMARAGQQVQYSCTTGDKPDNIYKVPRIMIEPYQRRGNVDIYIEPMNFVGSILTFNTTLTFNKTLTESDSGTDIYCKLWAHDDDNSWFELDSESFKLMVTPAATPDAVTEDPDLLLAISATPTMSVTTTSTNGVAELSVGDQIQVTCRVGHKPIFQGLNIHQVKGNLETVLISDDFYNYNETEVTFVTNVTKADDNTKVYCWYNFSPKYLLRSDYISLQVRSEDDINLSDEEGTEHQEVNVTTTIKPLLIIIPLLSIFAIFYH